jgi:hypothetical protein
MDKFPFEGLGQIEQIKEDITAVIAKIVKLVALAAAGIILQGSSPASAAEPSPEVEACRAKAMSQAAALCTDMMGCSGGMKEAMEESFLKGCLEDLPAEPTTDDK